MAMMAEDILLTDARQLPPWFKQKVPDSTTIRNMKDSFRSAGLHTVCESARCPNMGKCWEEGVATFMILGDICTRACRFCAVKTGQPAEVNPKEPRQVALAVARMALNYVVITSVTRDDLKDGGVQQFVDTVEEARRINPGIKIEVLIPDFSNNFEALKKIVAVKPEVIGHNIETVRRLSPEVRPQADYHRSLEVILSIKQLDPTVFVKSGLMVGLGETDEEVLEAMSDLLSSGCDILTVGQYLAPTQLKRHHRIQRFVDPDKFQWYRQKGLALGFKYIMSDPLVRSSYIAERGFKECVKIGHTDQMG